MDYEKKYNEALERAKVFKEHLLEINEKDYADEMGYIFPELKESEDEKIKKALADIIEHFLFWKDKGLTKEKVLGWLEKQGEQKPANKVEPKFKVGQTIKKEGFNLGFTIVKIEEGFYYNNMGDHFPFTDQDNWELVEKPAWSEEDDINYKRLLYFLDGGNLMQDHKIELFIWFKSLKDRIQPKQEWSEEDEERFESCIKVLQTSDGYDTINVKWLKSLKERYTWKPSDEQMKRLKGMINSLPHQEVLYSLYQDLKKLRGGIVMTKQEAIDKGYREFKGEGYTVLAHPRSCFFCDHCTDITYDFSNGPYMFNCNVEFDPDHIDMGLKGMCNNFKEE